MILKKGEINLLKPLIPSKKRSGDVLILILPVIISLFGALMVYSASKYNAKLEYNDEFFFLKKQLLGITVGIISMIIASFINLDFLNKIKLPLLILGYVLLVLVFTPLGVENYGAKRWIKVGGITVQPSEIAKFTFILFTAGYFDKDLKRAKSFLGILPVLLAGGITCLLIMLEPNMSITVCVGSLMLAMLFVSGVKIKHFLMIIIPLLICLPIFIIIEPYRLKRLMAFVNPFASPKGEGYQLLQSLYGLGSGGLFGVGLFNSRQKYRFLPFSESDFILSVIGEELGFFGTLIMFLVLFFLAYRGYRVASKSKTPFNHLLATGISTVFILQVAINALVCTGSIPPTGLPLPLISSGNTSVIVFLTAFGILYNTSKQTENY